MQKELSEQITKEQFEFIRPVLENGFKKTKPQKIDRFRVFLGILYIVRTGSQWRMLPKEYPNWNTVYFYFSLWADTKNGKSRLEIALEKLVEMVRVADGRDAKTSLCIIDSQSVKNTDTAKEKGYDGGKKISGIKRHVGVDTQGIPHVIHVTTADVTDREGALAMIEKGKEQLEKTQVILADGGYAGENFSNGVKKSLPDAEVQVVKRNELHKFIVMPKRWIVERSFAWMDKFRRLWKNCERYLNTSKNMIVLVFIVLLSRRI
jgi:transposase